MGGSAGGNIEAQEHPSNTGCFGIVKGWSFLSYGCQRFAPRLRASVSGKSGEPAGEKPENLGSAPSPKLSLEEFSPWKPFSFRQCRCTLAGLESAACRKLWLVNF